MRACFKLWSIVAVSLALLAGPLRAEFAYEVAGGVVFAYRVSDNGALTPVSGSPFSTGGASSSVAVDLLGRFVYVANGVDNGSVSAFRIDPTTGALTAVPGSPFPAGSFPNSVAVDFLRRFVYVANGGSFPAFNGSVSAYRIADNGALTPVARSPFPAGISSSSVAVDLFGRFVYVANSGSNTNSLKPGSVSAYRIAENGALTPVTGSPFLARSSAPISVAVDLFGRLVYVANQASNNVSAYRIAENGVLTPVVGSPFPAGILPTSLAVDLLGEFVYVANQGNSSVSGSYNVSAYRSENGVLTPVAKSPFAAGNTPYSVGVDLFGRFVYVGNGLASNISAFRIGANGALTPVAGSPFPTGILPRSVAFSP